MNSGDLFALQLIQRVFVNIDVILVNSFTENGKGGNPAGVVFNADHLSDAQKLKIAQEVGYSETAFVATDDVADYAVSFFTITGEVDFCGHATLAAFSAMFESNIIRAGSYTQRTKAGILSVTVESTGLVLMEQQLAKKLTFFHTKKYPRLLVLKVMFWRGLNYQSKLFQRGLLILLFQCRLVISIK